ncbi:MAG: hypothetical protein F6K26_09240 [Moorea sp. SIO2I5]|nr:hypothetical protein [Moorena sp. SIO2I5]
MARLRRSLDCGTLGRAVRVRAASPTAKAWPKGRPYANVHRVQPTLHRTPKANNQTTFNQTTFNQTTFNQTTFNQTTFNQTTFNQTTFNQTTFNQTTFNQTTFKMIKIRNRPNSVRAECGVRSERKHLSPLFPLYVTVYFFSAISKPVEKFLRLAG